MSESEPMLGESSHVDYVSLTDTLADRKATHHADSGDYTWDYVMVFKVGDPNKEMSDQFAKIGKFFTNLVPLGHSANAAGSTSPSEEEFFAERVADVLAALQNSGLRVCMYKSVQKDEVYCLIAATEARLLQEAAKAEYDLLLDDRELLRQATDRKLRLALATHSMEPQFAEFTEDSWRDMYGPYIPPAPNQPMRNRLYKHYDEGPQHQNTIFRTADRLKLTLNIMEADPELGGAGLRIGLLEADDTHPLAACFCLHQEDRKAEIESQWFVWHALWHQPLAKVRDYFGEQVAFYFAFLQFYSNWLIAPSVFGVACWIHQMALGRVDVAMVPFFAVFVSMWATLLLEFWKRRVSELNVKWGTTHFLAKEQPRPGFSGDWKPSPVTGHIEEVFDWKTKVMRSIFSQTVILTFILVVVGSVVGIFIFRIVLIRWYHAMGGYLAAIINAVQIQILNAIYGWASRKLNDYENHRTESEYANALIAKSFLFKFVNSYNSLFYIAFFRRFDGDDACGPDHNCLPELQKQLGTIFVTQIVINNLIELGKPYLMSKWKQRQNDQGVTAEALAMKSSAEYEYDLEPFESTFEDFDELAIQYGYATMFVVAFPLTPLFALVNNLFELRLDSYKLCRQTRRPDPRGATDIGTWYDIFNILGFISVITNCALVVFGSDRNSFVPDDIATKFAVFFVAEHLLFLIKFAIGYFVPDQPNQVKTQLARQEFLVETVLRGMEEKVVAVEVQGATDETAEASAAERRERTKRLYDFANIPDHEPSRTNEP